MIETPHLTINEQQLGDIPIQEHYVAMHPEILELDPPVGESRKPEFFSVFHRGVFNRLIGLCCLYNPTPTGIEIGVRIFIPDYWNKGYGREVVEGLCVYVFSVFPNVTTVFAKTPVLNIRAQKCYEKCGFIQYSLAVIGGYNMVLMKKEKPK